MTIQQAEHTQYSNTHFILTFLSFRLSVNCLHRKPRKWQTDYYRTNYPDYATCYTENNINLCKQIITQQQKAIPAFQHWIFHFFILQTGFYNTWGHSMKRHYYISDNLDELKSIESELEEDGVKRSQIHVLSNSDAEVEKKHLHEVESVLKQDVVYSTEVGAIIGLIISAFILLGAYFLELTQTPAGWVPFGFLAIITLGFCTWEGGLFGIQEPHHEFKQFRKTLKQGKHIFFVDITRHQEKILQRVVSMHPDLEIAGIGPSTPTWIINLNHQWRKFIRWAP